MSASPTFGDASVRRYIQQLSLRSPGASRHYHGILSRFQCFLAEGAGAGPLSVAVIHDWLRHHTALRPIPVVLYDARLVDRFLDWAVSTRLLQSNPFAELRK